METGKTKPIQGTLFEEDFLVRTLGAVANSADVALTELVANAWDAGASVVQITIPDAHEKELIVEDDGCGMTPKQFKERWMTLGYNRIKHQGPDAEFPDERKGLRRHAYGRNGVGRHGLLCFSSSYEVETSRDGQGAHYVVSTYSGKNPFVILTERLFSSGKRGTRLVAAVKRNLPSPDRIREVISARFLHDPQFSVLVNARSVPLAEHTGLLDRTVLDITDKSRAEAFFIDSTKTARTTRQQGVAFWVGGRLVGTPSWWFGSLMFIDGRSTFAKRYIVVIKSDDLFDEVIPDWSAFKDSETVSRLVEAVAGYVDGMFKKISADRIQDTKESVLREHRDEIEKLQPLARLEISEFIEEVSSRQPTVLPEALSLGVQAVIQLEKSRSGNALLEKLSKLSEEDVEGLDRLLSEWSIRDALTVLDEIDRRMAVVEALGKLSGDKKVDELRTLHPLVTQARWLFGPEFDTAEYASNLSLRRAVEKVFQARLSKEAFENYRKRPDLLLLADATLSAVCIHELDSESKLSKMRDVLLIELKRGGSVIGRSEVRQAEGYVEDLIGCGLLDGQPYIRAFVIGHEPEPGLQPVRTIGENPARARIQACTYSQLVRTAEQRLFRLKERLHDRYDQVSTNDLMSRILSEPKQLALQPN